MQSLDVEAAAVKVGSSLIPDVSLSSTHLLRWSSRLLSEDIAAGSRFKRFHEHSSAEGEQWLRASANNGNVYAMESLALKLFNGEGLEQSRDEAMLWLRRAADLGSSSAVMSLAECLLHLHLPSTIIEAEQLLQACVSRGSTAAMVILGSWLISCSNPSPGKELLLAASKKGNQLAHVKLATYLLSLEESTQHRREGLFWLKQIGATEADHLSCLAHYSYVRSLSAPTERASRSFAKDAAVLFREAVVQGNEEDRINLAYLTRRGEIDNDLSLDGLLAKYVSTENSAALMNQALRLAKGVQCTMDWKVADILVGKISDADAILSWWLQRGEEGDSEGHLVVGWLIRHQLSQAPDQISLEQRINLARAGGWLAPDWMNHFAYSSP